MLDIQALMQKEVHKVSAALPQKYASFISEFESDVFIEIPSPCPHVG